MSTKYLDIVADDVQIHSRARGRPAADTASRPTNLFSHEESLSGSNGLPSQRGGHDPRYGLCYA